MAKLAARLIDVMLVAVERGELRGRLASGSL